MITIGSALGLATALAGLGVLAAVLSPARVRGPVVGSCTVGVGGLSASAGILALTGDRFEAAYGWLLPLGGANLSVDALSGLFLAVTGAVVSVAAIYGIGYTAGQHGPRGRGVQAMIPIFAWAMVMVVCAASVTTLLFSWELMALSSLLLVLAEHRYRPAVASAGWWYAVMTQSGFLAIMLGLSVFAAGAGDESFAALRTTQLSPAAQGLVFVLTFVGFGSKAGLAPWHVWLPRAHAEAPSQISAMLSAAMVNLGVYGVLRVGFDLLGGGSRWWWLLVLAIGAISALYGILQAAVATDLKRLLAYSTVENLGLVFIGVAAGGVFATSGAPELAALALAAALLHVMNHAGFKALLFGAAGAVLRATGTRDLDALGGLRARMPATTALFAVGALGAMALPPGNGFVSEWLLLQALVHGAPGDDIVLGVAMPLAVGVVALTAGLAVATFVKALGVGFFARARSTHAQRAHEPPWPMLAGMGLLAAACAALALAPTVLGPALSRAVSVTTGTPATPISGDGVTLRLTGIQSTFAPLVLVALLLAAMLATAAVARTVRLGVLRRRAAPLWDCGAGAPTARMQYTATSFAEPLQRVFDDVLAPKTDVQVTPFTESRYLVARVAYQQQVPDRIEHRLYTPILAALRRVGRLSAVLANGSVHRYLGYGLVGVTLLLVVLAVLR